MLYTNGNKGYFLYISFAIFIQKQNDVLKDFKFDDMETIDPSEIKDASLLVAAKTIIFMLQNKLKLERLD